MTKSEPPVEIPHPLFTRRQQQQSVAESQPEEHGFHPRYVQLQALREHGHGARNLAWGVATLLIAFVLLSLALFFAGSKALLALGACLATCVALFVLARLHVFRQRNGGFLAIGLVSLLGAAIPLMELGYRALDAFVHSRTTQTAAPIVAQTSEVQPMLLSAAFALTEPDPNVGPRVKVLKDSRVPIDGKPFLIKAGEIFPLGGKGNGEVTLVVRDLLVALPADATEILEIPMPTAVAALDLKKDAATPIPQKSAGPAAGAEEARPASETPAETTARSQREAIRRYPALGVKDSMENKLFVSTFQEIREAGGDDFFKNPEWPIELAELLAHRKKWVRGALPATTSDETPAAATDENAAAPDAVPDRDSTPPVPPPAATAPPSAKSKPVGFR